MSHPQDLSLREQAAAVAAGELDARELLSATLARIAERDGELNSVIATFPEQSEEMLASAPRGPLHGVPIAVKDMYTLPWRGPRDGTSREQLPPGESAVFRALRDAGAVVVGHTNTHFWGGGSTGHISAYGPVGNPWDVKRCGGGSSGGSAASVGARLVAGSVGADGGGSIRLPGAYCGVTGLKSTFGAVPADGYSHPQASVDAHGPFCRDAADARLLGEVLLGGELPAGDGSGLRAAVVHDPFWTDLDPDVERACRDALDASGWSVEEIALDGAEHAQVAAVLRLTLEGIPALDEEDLREADPLMRALVKYEKLLPAELLVRADRVRAQLRRSAAAAFERFDLLVWPTVPAPAPLIEAPVIDLPSGQYPADAPNVRQTGFGNLCGIPGITVPAGLSSGGMPIGLQLQAGWGREAVLLDAAEHLERATDRAHVDALPPIAAAAA
ncbi:MAG: aspartyl-tRNA(Asn)/glutamyl-tRNA(Gln) amidotransferase subunit [Thermoleophilaceae bacterium]|nr:aspartyl-tRNA(Asn)/glutamyl-tRNA(Gln) amidotransferase subunit [Thermoleophilaceae bacterium]